LIFALTNNHELYQEQRMKMIMVKKLRHIHRNSVYRETGM
jgi:hypothetical protein